MKTPYNKPTTKPKTTKSNILRVFNWFTVYFQNLFEFEKECP
jgi:hypothetical protein